MLSACTFSIANCLWVYEFFRNTDRLKVAYYIISWIKFAHIYPSVILTTRILSDHHRTCCNNRTVSTLPIRAVRCLDVFLFDFDLWSLSVVSYGAVIIDCKPMICVNRHRVVPWKSRCFVSKLCKRIVHKTRTVNAEIIYRFNRKRSVLTLIIRIPVPLVSIGIRCTQQGRRLCDHRIRWRECRVFSRWACGTCCDCSAHRWTEHRKSTESCHEPCAEFF